MVKKPKSPYIRDVYLAYLIDGAGRTETDGFAIIEEWMVATEPPKEIIQWDRRQDLFPGFLAQFPTGNKKCKRRTGLCRQASKPVCRRVRSGR